MDVKITSMPLTPPPKGTKSALNPLIRRSRDPPLILLSSPVSIFEQLSMASGWLQCLFCVGKCWCSHRINLKPPAVSCVHGMSTDAARRSLGQPLSGTQAKMRLRRVGSRAPGEPFSPDFAIAAHRRGAIEKAVRKTEDEDWLHYKCPRSGSWSLVSPYTSCLHIVFDAGECLRYNGEWKQVKI